MKVSPARDANTGDALHPEPLVIEKWMTLAATRIAESIREGLINLEIIPEAARAYAPEAFAELVSQTRAVIAQEYWRSR